MKRSLLFVLFLLFPLVTSAQVYYKDLGLIPADRETIFSFNESFPEFEDSLLVDLLNTAETNPIIDTNSVLEFVTVVDDTVYITPTLDTAPGFYSLLFLNSSELTRELFILSFRIGKVVKFQINPQGLRLDGYANQKKELACEITSNSDWELYVQSLGEYPDIEISIEEKTVYPDNTPSLLISGSKSQQPKNFQIAVKLSDSYKDIPASHYVFPIIFTLSTFD